MRRKLVMWVVAIAVACVCFAVAGCGTTETKYTVRYVYGDEILRTDEVKGGEKVTQWRPVKEGYVFKGWYVSQDESADAYSFDTPVGKDTDVYARFEKALEIRVKGSYITGWEHIATPEYTMNYDAENDVYTYSHEFIEGDAFMFYNFEKTVDEKGETHFGLGKININSDCVDKEKSTENLTLVPASNIMTKARGTYSFVYDENINKVTVTYADAFTKGYTPNTIWYIAGGGITQPLKSSNFGRALTDAHKLIAVAGKENTYALTLDLAKGDMFQIVSGQWYGMARKFEQMQNPEQEGTKYFALKGDNVEVKTAGNYTLTLTCDPLSPLGDKITWVRNGDVVQELPIVYDVFMKCSADKWVPSQRYTATDGVVKLNAYFAKDDQFCFIYYDPGVDESEVGSFDNLGSLITGAMKGEEKKSNFNKQIGEFENNFLCLTGGHYSVRIDFNGGSPVVDFIGYSETVPEFTAIVKGPAYNGDASWGESDPLTSQGGKVEFVLTLTATEGNPSASEFGFVWRDENSDQYGNWVGASCLGTNGDANDYMVVEGKNNFECQRTGKYRIVLSVLGGKATIDFYFAD